MHLAHRDLQEPVAKAVGLSELGPSAERGRKCLLSDVFRVAVVRQQATRGAENDRDVTPVDRLFRPSITVRRATHELRIRHARRERDGRARHHLAQREIAMTG